MPDDRQQRGSRAPDGGERKRGARMEALGRSRGGLTTKIHLTVDGNGKPRRMILTGGQRHDAPQAPALLEGMEYEFVIADKGYDSQKILDLIEEHGAVAVIPPRKNRKEQREYDRELYKRRNVIERTVNKLKEYRRIATRYDRKTIYYLSFLHLAAAVTWSI